MQRNQFIPAAAAQILASKPNFHQLGRTGRHAVGANARKAGQTPVGDNIRLKGHKPGGTGRRLN